AAGHDINYLALSGALHAIGRAGEPPVPPLNLVGDYGGGGMMLAVGVLSALQERQRSGLGQVVDAAMGEGAALLSALFYGMRASGRWSGGRGENHLDGGAHFYGTYLCADGRYVAVGAIEPQFYTALMVLCGIEGDMPAAQWDRARWPSFKAELAKVFLRRSRDAWCELAAGQDSCMSPVLDWDEAPSHPHHRARDAFVTLDGVVQPAPVPRFSRTPSQAPRTSRDADEALLRAWGVAPDLVAALRPVA
ncbi:MAG: CoA transferase, partial [Comamonadaceae bacterium]